MNPNSLSGLSTDNNRRLHKTYDSRQVQEILGVSKSYLDKLCHFGKIPYHTFEGQRKRYFFEDDLIAFQGRLTRHKTTEEIIHSGV